MDQCENLTEMKEWWTELEKLMSMNVDKKQQMQKAITIYLLTKNDFLSEIRDNDGNGILHYIAKFDSALITNFCISKNCDVNLLNNDENPPLAVAVEYNNLETVKALIEAGAIHDHFYFKHHKGPLHMAAEKRYGDMTKYLISIGANVNAYTNVADEEKTPLHVVFDSYKTMENNQCMEVVKALVEAGADVNAKDDSGSTPLFDAIKNECNNVIELLLNAGASCSITDDEGRLPYANIKSDDIKVEIIKRFIASESEIDRKLWNGRTGLYYAVEKKLPKTVKCMLENGASVDIFDFRHLDPLSFAFFEWEFDRSIGIDESMDKCLECITLLLNHGFDLNRTNKYGLTPFYYALQTDSDEKIVSLLLDRGATFEFDHSVVQTTIRGNRDPKVSKALLKHMITHDFQDRNGEPLNFTSLNLDKELHIFSLNLKIDLGKALNKEVPLTYSNESAKPAKPVALCWAELEGLLSHERENKQNKEKAIIDHLMTWKDFLPKIRDANGNGILHYVSRIDGANIIKFCISSGCNVNLLNNDKNPPLFVAVECNKLETVNALIEAGAIHDNFYYKHHKGPLHIAVEKRHVDIIKCLVKIGANVNAYTNYEFDDTPLHVACSSYETTEHIQCIEVVKTLINAGAEINAKDNYGSTPLCDAVSSGFNDAIELLLNTGARVDIIDFENNTPLHYVDRGPISARSVELLIKAGIDVNFVNVYGRSPLFCVAENTSTSALITLLQQGAKIDAVDHKDYDPICFSLYENGHDKVNIDYLEYIKILLDHGADVNRVNRDCITPLSMALLENCPIKVVNLLLTRGAIVDFNSVAVQKTMRMNEDPHITHLLIKNVALLDSQRQNDESTNNELKKIGKDHLVVYSNCKEELNFMKKMYLANSSITYFDCLVDKNVRAGLNKQQIIDMLEGKLVRTFLQNYGELLVKHFSEDQINF